MIAVNPPAEVVPATIKAAVVMHAGHMSSSVLIDGRAVD
jgi:hypothetical protein